VPWKVQSPMSLREELVTLASAPDANFSALCRRFGVSRKTGYKWIARHRTAGSDGGGDDVGAGDRVAEALADRSRRPRTSPTRTSDDLEQLVVSLRHEHPSWGARKLKRRLADLGHQLPARSTVNGILARHGLIDPAESLKRVPVQRFERLRPNELWEVDFKGHFPLGGGGSNHGEGRGDSEEEGAGRCHPLTALDDCTRFSVLLRACGDERLETARAALVDAMRRYGLPEAILCDNGPPWGSFGQEGNWTRLGVWLVRRGVRVLHGRPSHPQTQGKGERFHRTLKAEAIGTRRFRDLGECQAAFDAWRDVYNLRRPHEALDLATPASRYSPSPLAFREAPPPIEYGPGDAVRKVSAEGCVSFRGQPWRVGRAFASEPVALRPTLDDGRMDVFYCHQRVAEVDLRSQSGGG
jgi:transposase InsO family protein